MRSVCCLVLENAETANAGELRGGGHGATAPVLNSGRTTPPVRPGSLPAIHWRSRAGIRRYPFEVVLAEEPLRFFIFEPKVQDLSFGLRL